MAVPVMDRPTSLRLNVPATPVIAVEEFLMTETVRGSGARPRKTIRKPPKVSMPKMPVPKLRATSGGPEQRRDGVPVSLSRLVVVDRVRDLPPNPEGQAQEGQVLLERVVDDGTVLVLDHGFVGHPQSDVLANGDHELREVTREQPRTTDSGPHAAHWVGDREAVERAQVTREAA